MNSIASNLEEQKRKADKKRKRRKIIRQDLIGWSLGGLPFIGGCILFGLFPKIIGYMLPFFSLEGTNLATMKFVGFDNFIYLFTNPESKLWSSFATSCYYLLSVPICLTISLFVAVQLDKNIRGAKVFRVIMFLPTFVSGVAMSIFWRYVFQPETGLLNTIIKFFGGTSFDFLNTAWSYMPSVLLTTTWGACANCILFQAALGQVNESMKEAARIDGATERQLFWKITFPAITPTFFYQLLMSFIGALQVFTSLQLLSNGTTGPNDAALSLVYYIYVMAFEWTGRGAGLGMATACGFIFKWFILLLTVIVFKTSDRWVSYDN